MGALRADDRDEQLLSIGQLARLSGLTSRALRHYHRLGLLSPDTVDPVHGRRYYSPDAIRSARLIAALRELDVPLDDVRTCLHAIDDEAALTAVLTAHGRRLSARSARVRGSLHRLDHLLAEGDITMALTEPEESARPTEPPDQRRLAADLFNGVWTLMEKEDRTRDEDDRMIHMAHASRYHWEAVGTPANLARGEWQCSRVYAVLGRGEPSLHHARRVLDICQENDIGDWDLAFAYEAIARAYAVSGDPQAARDYTEQALAAADDIAEDEERALVMADLETIPGQPRFW